jgi:regulator of protease activity HflC (stomatin/prohibitin superfamily)
MNIKGIITLALLFLVLLATTCTVGYTRIEASNTGIKVAKYGDNKGVAMVDEVRGGIWYNKWYTDVHQIPNYIQNIKLKPIVLTTKDQLTTEIKVAVNYSVKPNKAVPLFLGYRSFFKNDEVDLSSIVDNYTREAFSEVSEQYKAEDLIQKKAEFKRKAEAIVKKRLADQNLHVEKVFLIGDPTTPDGIKESIERKVKATQIAQMKEDELRQSIAESAKKIESAKGDAEALRIKGEAEADYYKTVGAAINANMVQMEMIKKWNGKNSETVLGTNSSPMINLGARK